MSGASAATEGGTATADPALPSAGSREGRTVLAASLIGTTIEWYDFFLFATAAGIVFPQLFSGSGDPTVATLLSFATFAIGVAAPILLVALRVIQGIAIGGEWGGAVLMAVEYAPPGKRGVFGATPQIGLGLGLALGTGAFALLGAVMDDQAFIDYGWRIAFVASVVLVVIGFVVRLAVLETPVFRRLQEAAGSIAAALRARPLERL